MDNESPIIVALDRLGPRAALHLAEQLENLVWGFKVNDLFFQEGYKILELLQDCGHVMCDGKFHDIPNTGTNTLSKLAPFADIFTVHASGGRALVAAAATAAPGKIAAITILTSLDAKECREIYGDVPAERVPYFARKAQEAGASYMVCSGKELPLVEHIALKKIVPGIRPSWYVKGDDQKRVVTPAKAIEGGADLLVIGRPIVEADDPTEAAKRTLEEIQKAAEKA